MRSVISFIMLALLGLPALGQGQGAAVAAAGGGSWSNYPYFESRTIVVTSSREGLFMLKKREVDL